MFSLLSLLDDIATTFDDVAIMSKVAIKKTSALMSDDLAVNAGVIHGVNADQELPMVWKIFVGSLLNKLYSILGVVALTYFYPPALQVVLLIGGIYLAYEGAHKVLEKVTKQDSKKNLAEISEEKKVSGAIRTDLILSIEIIVIAQNSISGPFVNQLMTLVIVGLLASILIYGLVAILVKIDDLGLYLIRKEYKKLGYACVSSMPWIMRGLGIVGTIAMFLVAGGIFAHSFHLDLYTYEVLQNLFLGLVGGFSALILQSILSHIKSKFLR
ncbi:DUF808 family protein [Halobacteriovorax sp. CON-3]|uniref:DUF808 family protein n=1 Tax=Halobacteriovorax sp. CON-3 TaxID=3157710 RepID=UPI00371AFAFA